MSITKWIIALLRSLVDQWPRIGTMARRVRDQLDFMEEPKATHWGFNLAGNAAMAQGTFEPIETELVRKMLREVDILVNVGANVGYYCCHALSMGKPVIAFEPIARNLHYLCKNVKSNGWSGVEVFPIALSNNVGILEIYGGNTGASVVRGWAGTAENYMTLVPCSTMDVVLGSRLQGQRALILVDVEGAEQWMLEGATIMLANDPKPIWIVEIATTDHQPLGVEMNPNLRSTFQLFFQNGYQAFIFDRVMRQISMEQVEFVLSGSRKFVTHNFMFCEPKE